ncbi:helix-turn-helix domain-containing protein [Methylocystis heyeri]|uniref:Helix-turn-helix domain-containing protein n=1 Tax=Methylocystis heyeri TaxID=391905 RepID=A0A6B8KJM4_9HYPH|nr:AraC family transcriptional regulator [Methylocystis heyeri]QGM46790.1 helix-turn-helix domain-containing protein [Methylocystis heyeri]
MPLPPGYSESIRIGDRVAPVEAAWRYFAEMDGEHRVLPDGRCDLILRFHSDGESALGDVVPVIAGPATRFHLVPLAGNTAFVGVRLRPGIARAVLGIELAPLVNRVFVGQDTLALIPALSQLRLCGLSIEQIAAQLDAFVAERCSGAVIDLVALSLIDSFHVTGGRVSVEDVARSHGVHPKTVRRKISGATGLTPKQYTSIVRFHRALRLRRDAGLDAVAAAFEAGFADQPHMSRTFRHMGGISAAKPVTSVLAGLPI